MDEFSKLREIVINSGLFDEKYYLANNIDVKLYRMDPVAHYLNFGWKEGRNPSLRFNSNSYLDYYPDVKAAGSNPLLHFIIYGYKEGRILPPIELESKINNLWKKKFKDSINKSKVNDKSILLIRMGGGIGDYILFRNFIEILRNSKKYSGYEITFVGNPIYKDFSEKIDANLVDNFIWLDNNSLFEIFSLKGKLIDLVKKKPSYEVIINPILDREFYKLYLMVDNLVYFLNAKEKITSKIKISKNLVSNKLENSCYTKFISLDNQLKFEFNLYKEFFEKLLNENINIKKPNIEFKNSIENPFSKFKLPEKFILLGIGAGDTSRKWSILNFVEIAKYIKAKYKIPLVLSGGKGELLDSDNFGKLFGDYFINLVGKTTLLDLIDITSKSTLIISNESSLVHLAVASNAKKILVISNGNTVGRFVPYPKEIIEGYYVVYNSQIEKDIEYYKNNFGIDGYHSSLDINDITPNKVIVLTLTPNFHFS